MTVEHMQQEILHAFAEHNEHYKKNLEAGLKHAIETFDFEAEVLQIANRQLQATCETMVKEVVQDLRYNIDFQVLCRSHLIKMLETYQEADMKRIEERKPKK